MNKDILKFNKLIELMKNNIELIKILKLNNEETTKKIRKKKVIKAAIKMIKDNDILDAGKILYTYHKPLQFIFNVLINFFINKYCKKYQ